MFLSLSPHTVYLISGPSQSHPSDHGASKLQGESGASEVSAGEEVMRVNSLLASHCPALSPGPSIPGGLPSSLEHSNFSETHKG